MVSPQIKTWNHTAPSRLEVCIPFYKDDPSVLIRQLGTQSAASQIALLVCDDGSQSAQLTQTVIRALDTFPGAATLLTLPQNMGRGQARNTLISHAKADWLLMLDADMDLPDDGFIATYLAQIDDMGTPACIVGGFSVNMTNVLPKYRLHAHQARISECVSAQIRSQDQGRFVFTSNIVVHRDIARTIGFHPDFKGWGWEDVEWGLRVVQLHPVRHIDNPAVHVGLDDDATLIGKYGQSADNFKHVKRLHPKAINRSPLARAARLAALVPGSDRIAPLFAQLAKQRHLPMKLRILSLKLFRAALYSNAYRG
jgi:glycosyltransferase involved in cell wall biosynthesis